MNDEFAQDVLTGLSSNPKYISSKYFYDKVGSDLFVQIMHSDEYYVTDAELDIFQNKTSEIIDGLALDKDQEYEIIELGAGDGSKTIHLLSALLERKYSIEYIPIDISIDALKGLEKSLSTQLPDLSIKAQHGEYFSVLNQLKNNKLPKIILFLGSNLGNLTDEQSTEFIYALGCELQTNNKILLGLDMIKSREIVLPAYNDAKGITAEFNYNLLRRMNRELDADFVIDQFIHAPDYIESEGIAKSFLKSLVDQKVTIGRLNKIFYFNKGELLQTEMSRKYNNEVIGNILNKTDFKITDKIVDSKNLYANYIIEKC